MRIVALIAVRNEELYISRCLEHLCRNGIEFCLIDNGSTDRTVEAAKDYLGRGLIRIVPAEYPGFYDWVGLLKLKQQLAIEIDADWFIHHDADEIMESPVANVLLADAIASVDAAGFNAINFDEFVFVPTDESESFEGTDYVERMRHYYFFEPHPVRLVRCWKKALDIELAESGGHEANFEGRWLFPQSFVLRHYIVLSAAHARRKYSVQRSYSEEEVRNRGWHGWRAKFRDEMVRLPSRGQMFEHAVQTEWNRTQPHKNHIFITQSR
ncbi:glycosyltransferase family A protein [Mesorhizobium humile]|uniref:Glycosyltransferase family A protein n=1 Tax=Mesorhizobium humile TaxID=3072313 RepID=A0ABU4YDH8_9HYPH|nr:MULTISPECIES: glycosyltransferase family A protein [unclassified Mesorhizobium]MDX8459212.1 glycosyltransferase family A protein [Mesorhizobium sp. VK2D]MDX8484995.1 glycosyltransferase family A protein [Mesorhizobium sp. VK2B]